jgi:hypothetical protein
LSEHDDDLKLDEEPCATNEDLMIDCNVDDQLPDIPPLPSPIRLGSQVGPCKKNTTQAPIKRTVDWTQIQRNKKISRKPGKIRQRIGDIHVDCAADAKR